MSIEALLLAVRDVIRDPSSPFDYGKQACDVRADGQPPPRCGAWFVAVHQLPSRNESLNNLDEYFSYAVTLTGRLVNCPPDRVGDAMLAMTFAKKTGFNKRLNKLKRVLAGYDSLYPNMDWAIIAAANNYIVQFATEEGETFVYGFSEPAHFANAELPDLVGGEWFESDPASENVGLKATLTFSDARRLQPRGQGAST